MMLSKSQELDFQNLASSLFWSGKKAYYVFLEE